MILGKFLIQLGEDIWMEEENKSEKAEPSALRSCLYADIPVTYHGVSEVPSLAFEILLYIPGH